MISIVSSRGPGLPNFWIIVWVFLDFKLDYELSISDISSKCRLLVTRSLWPWLSGMDIVLGSVWDVIEHFFSELSIIEYSDYVCGCPCVKQIMLKCFFPYHCRLFWQGLHITAWFWRIYSSILPSKIEFCIRYTTVGTEFRISAQRSSRSEMRYKTNPDSQGGNHPETSKKL